MDAKNDQPTEFERLRQFIERGNFAEQGRLPSERELAATLGLTRNKLRIGLQRLETEGLIWRHVGKGTYVGSRPIENGIRHAVSEVTNPREIMEARMAFEPELARLAAFRGTGRDFAEMDRCVERMMAETRWEQWEQLDTRLHRCIAQAAQNELLFAMFEMMADLKTIWGRLRQEPNMPARVGQSTLEHAEIVRALRDRDADGASKLMRAHLQNVRKNIFGEGEQL
jgi:DNA-binding FadR family transcriptional regulator